MNKHPSYAELYAASARYRHTHICAVIAIGAICDVSYERALSALQDSCPGYTPRYGRSPWPYLENGGYEAYQRILEACQSLGWTAHALAVLACTQTHTTIEQFARMVPVGRFLTHCRSHTVAVIDGQIAGSGARCRVKSYWEMTRRYHNV